MHSCFLRGVGVFHGVREERRESEILSILQRVGGYCDGLHQYIHEFGLNHLSQCIEIFFNFLIFEGIFGLIFVLAI
jgi:hypothetical protein